MPENPISKVDKDICRKILLRGLKTTFNVRIGKHVFTGKAKDWEEANDPNFKACLEKGGVCDESRIDIYHVRDNEQGPVYHVWTK